MRSQNCGKPIANRLPTLSVLTSSNVSLHASGVWESKPYSCAFFDLADFLAVLPSDEDDGPLIDLGRAQGSKPEQSPAEKMVLNQSSSKAEDSKGNVIPCVYVIDKSKPCFLELKITHYNGNVLEF